MAFKKPTYGVTILPLRSAAFTWNGVHKTQSYGRTKVGHGAQVPLGSTAFPWLDKPKSYGRTQVGHRAQVPFLSLRSTVFPWPSIQETKSSGHTKLGHGAHDSTTRPKSQGTAPARGHGVPFYPWGSVTFQRLGVSQAQANKGRRPSAHNTLATRECSPGCIKEDIPLTRRSRTPFVWQRPNFKQRLAEQLGRLRQRFQKGTSSLLKLFFIQKCSGKKEPFVPFEKHSPSQTVT